MNNKELKELIKIFEASSLSRMRLEKSDTTIELEKPVLQTPKGHIEALNPVSIPVVPIISNSYEVIKAPLVGTYYEAPAPDQPPFVRVGQTVKKGDTLCIIEAMKVMNEITAVKSGKIVSMHVKNGEMVMYNQVIMEID